MTIEAERAEGIDGRVDFWADASHVFDEATAIGDLLSTTKDFTAPMISRVQQLAQKMPEDPEAFSGLDPYLRDALLTAVIQALNSANKRDRSGARVAVERIRQALRDLTDERPVWQGGPKHAAQWLVHSAGISPHDLGELLNVADDTVRKWATPSGQHPNPEHADRVVVLAKIVNHLRHAMTARGAVRWLQRPNDRLDGIAPVDFLKDEESYRKLIHLASGTRSMLAT